MKIRADALKSLPRPAKAANEDFVSEAHRQKPEAGWDAYEVWRTRIKAEQDQPRRGPGAR